MLWNQDEGVWEHPGAFYTDAFRPVMHFNGVARQTDQIADDTCIRQQAMPQELGLHARIRGCRKVYRITGLDETVNAVKLEYNPKLWIDMKHIIVVDHNQQPSRKEIC